MNYCKRLLNMNLHEQLAKAIEIAIEAHRGQKDRSGQPYIGHPFRVMNAGKTCEEKIVGMLHDVVEDTEWTLEELLSEGFSRTIVDAVEAMTKLPEEAYDIYLSRLKKNPIAARVKLNDLTDNMDIRRLHEIREDDVARLKKYLNAYRQLTFVEKLETSSGITQ